jgi:hypothetical protein
MQLSLMARRSDLHGAQRTPGDVEVRINLDSLDTLLTPQTLLRCTYLRISFSLDNAVEFILNISATAVSSS